MKVAYFSAEVYPFSKVGGLADVAGSLPFFLKKEGIDVTLFTPLYSKFCDIKKYEVNEEYEDKIFFDENLRVFKWYKVFYKNLNVFLLKEDDFFGRDYIYAPLKGEDKDQFLRFSFFSYASILFLKKINFKPDIIHINDWHTSFLPIFLKKNFKEEDFFKNSKILLTIHNLAYQGIYEKDVLKKIKIEETDEILLNNKVNFLKGGIIFSDFINTVSPSYKEEILTPEYGC